MDTNDNKQLEEHIKQLLKNYSVPYTEEVKKNIIHNFENIKHHSSNINISLKEIAQNKTTHFIIIVIVSVMLLIYILAKLFPTDSSKNQPNTHSTSSDSTNHQIDTTTNITAPSLTTETNTSAATTPVSSNITAPSSLSEKDNPTNSTLHSSQKKDTLKNSSTSTINDNVSDKLIKKKKRKRNNAHQEPTQDNTLPVLEPKTPNINNDNVKEEE